MSSLVASRFANCIAHRMSDPSAQSSSSVGREDVSTVVEQLKVQQLEFQTQCSQALRDEIRSFMDQAQRALRDRSPAHHSEATIDEDEAWDVDYENAWSDVLPKTEAEPQGRGAQLALRLAFPPPLQSIKSTRDVVKAYKGVPRAPGPRRGRIDRQMYYMQQKIETAMDILVQMADARQHLDIEACAAVLRSAWQDAQEIRRRAIAGRDSYKLDARIDAAGPRLFTQAEEKMLRTAPNTSSKGKGKGKGRPFRQAGRGNSDSRKSRTRTRSGARATDRPQSQHQ